MHRLPSVLLLAAILLALVPAPTRAGAAEPVQVTTQRVPVRAEPDGTPVDLDVAVYKAGNGQQPAVLLGHGFGGSRTDVDTQARDLAEHGYLVLTWTARGFGDSGGRIHLDAPDYEVADARALVDLLATRDDVALDAPDDPHVGVVGGSYGGALALMLAGTDPRIDTVAALITWNDLDQALFPQAAVDIAEAGPLKQQWISRFFSASVQQGLDRDPPAPAPCGRFDPTVCRELLAAAQTGRPSANLRTMLRSHSPTSVLAGLQVPTLLVQGMRDTLFGLDQADKTARALLDHGTEVAVRWTDGGHDGPASDPDADTDAVRDWLDRHLRGDLGAASVPAFSWALPVPFGGTGPAQWRQANSYPGLHSGAGSLSLHSDGPGTMLAPPGGQPASITSGISGTTGQISSYPLAALPGQSIAFTSDPVGAAATVVGAPQVRLLVTSTADEVTLFVTLWQVNDTSASQPRALVAPVRVAVTPGRATPVAVELPAATWQLDKASTWRVLVTSTDSAFANSTVARADQIQLADPVLTFPTVEGTAVTKGDSIDTETIGLLVALIAVLLAVAVLVATALRRRAGRPVRTDLAEVPLQVENLTKSYPDGHRAVDGVSWQAARGQVVGLLGPNGAGKTTTLRMVLGLIRPDDGHVWVRGRPVVPGAPVLQQVGALVEGPGFLPHLSGRANLRAWWAATGRPESESAMDEALAVAALGDAVDRPVKSYSQGMRQRLGIAQAMLGQPDVLILDEPTNGLDPPQIAAMRPILRAYAETGRTVVVSSHLLAEVEQTCTHVVVMDGGRVITTGAVADLLDGEAITVISLATPVTDAALTALRTVDGITDVTAEEDTRIAVTAEMSRPDVVAAAVTAGMAVSEVTGRRHLEDLFLAMIAESGVHDADPSGPADAGGQTLADRLRKVRPR